MKNLNDLFYIQQAKSGDMQAFSQIVVCYQQLVLNMVFRITGNREDAEDITQEIFIRVFKSLHQFKEESEFSTWLYRIAYNTTLSEIRRKKITCVPFEDHFSDEKDEELSDDIDDLRKEERLQHLDKALKMLSPDEILLITLFYLNDQSIDEISQIANLSVANVKVKLHRTRKKLAIQMNQFMHND